jgi:hypothetical protein
MSGLKYNPEHIAEQLGYALLPSGAAHVGACFKAVRPDDAERTRMIVSMLLFPITASYGMAHTALENHDPMHHQEADRRALIRQFGDLRFKIGVPYLIIREFRKSFEERIGITEEQLQARLMDGQHDEGDA